MSKFSSLSIFNSGFSSGCSEYNSRRAYVGLTKKKSVYASGHDETCHLTQYCGSFIVF